MDRKVEEFQEIPKIEPMYGRCEQPASSRLLVDSEFACMFTVDFNSLAEYSCSTPTGAYVGKMWRRHDGAFDPHCAPEDRRWLLVWYGKHEDSNKVSINYRKIVLVDGRLPNG